MDSDSGADSLESISIHRMNSNHNYSIVDGADEDTHDAGNSNKVQSGLSHKISKEWEKVEKVIEKCTTKNKIEPKDQTILEGAKSEYCGTILDLVVRCGTKDQLKFLLKHSPFKTWIDKPNNEGETPLHTAVIRRNTELGRYLWALTALLQHDADPNVRDIGGRAPIHLVVEQDREKFKEEFIKSLQGSKLSEMCTFLDDNALSKVAGGESPDTPGANDTSDTPDTPDTPGAPGTPEMSGTPATPGTPPPAEETNNPTETAHAKKMKRRAKLYNFLMRGDYSNLYAELESTESPSEPDVDFYVGNKKLLCYVLNDRHFDLKTRMKVAEKLMEIGADPLSSDNRGFDSALVLALKLKQKHLLKCLVGKLKEKNTSYGHVSIYLLCRALVMGIDLEHDEERELETLEWLRFLFEIDAIRDVNQPDPLKKTALQIAAYYNYERVIVFLLKRGARINTDNKEDVLQALTPESLTELLDHFTRFETVLKEEGNGDAPCRAVLDYGFLFPKSTTIESNVTIGSADVTNETDILVTICDKKQHRQAITHALIWTLIMAKWSKLRDLNNAWSSVKIMCSLIVLILFTALAWPISTRKEDPIASADEQLGLKWTVITLCVINLAVDIVRLVLFWPLQWPVRDKRIVWVRLIYGTVITTLMVMFCAGIRSRSFVAWVLTGAWLDTAITASEKMKWFNVILTMFWKISKHIAKLCVLTLCFVMGSSISFSILIGPRQMNLNSTSLIDFTNPWLAFPRTIAMATGEFGYEELRHGLIEEGQPVASFFDVLFFIVFVFLVYLVIMNVMTGVAIIETKEILNSAEENQLRKKLEYIFLIEHFWDKLKKHFEWLNDRLKTKFDCKLFTSKPSLEVHLKTGKIEYYKNNNTPATKGAIALDADKTERIRCLFVKIRAERGKQNEYVTLQKNVQRLVDSKKQKTETTQL